MEMFTAPWLLSICGPVAEWEERKHTADLAWLHIKSLVSMHCKKE
jgi:hypothetical protein